MKIIVSGGGTGGHIYPALALIRHLEKNNPTFSCLYIGTENGLENKIVPAEGIPFKSVKISGFKRSLSIENIKTIGLFLSAVSKAKKFIKDFNPDVVVGTGGYVSGPVLYAAKQLKIPTVIHEQNSVPGLTNKFLARYTTKVAISFPESAAFFPREKIVETGNPRASEVIEESNISKNEVFASYGLNPARKTVLVVGGSRGAKAINEAILSSLPLWENTDYQCLYVTGEVHYEEVMEKIKEKNSLHILPVPYVHDMPQLLKHVDLIVGRAGATSLAEITSLGLPSILIPSPYVTNNHQEKNARALENAGAAKIFLEKELTGEKLYHSIDQIFSDESKRNDMAKGSKKLGRPDAAGALAGVLKGVIING